MSIRLRVTFVLIIVELASMVALSLTPRNYLYYCVCMPFNTLIVCALIEFPESKVVDSIQKLNVTALVFQYFGLISYFFSIPIVLYNVAIHAINLTQIYKLLSIGDDDGLARGDKRNVNMHNLPTFCTARNQE